MVDTLQNTYTEFEQLLSSYKEEVDRSIELNLSQFGPDNSLKEACTYALCNGGKRFRPAIVLMVSAALNQKLDVGPAALAVEYFHTASLIADDLPCMDNDDERRQKPSLHKAYNESTALLTTYALIASGYKKIHENAEIFKSSFPDKYGEVCCLALENAAFNTGILGATGGQFLDLSPPNYEPATLLEILHKKTVTLFEIAFTFGWLFGGGAIPLLKKVKETARHWGLAFQIADDLQDACSDEQKKALNIANVLGKEQALSFFHRELKLLEQHLSELGLDSADFKALIKALLKVVPID